MPLRWLTSFDPERTYFYPSDKFTAASFVSHSPSKSVRDLADVDFLPKIKDKILVTSDLSPMFHGKRETMSASFSILTRVLDGRGLTSDSGAHGRRGYDGRHVFQWLGATTALTPEAWEVMGQVGPRLVFFRYARKRPSWKDLPETNESKSPGEINRLCEEAVHRYLRVFFKKYEKGVTFDEVSIPRELRLRIRGLGDLLTRLRAVTPREGEGLTDTLEYYDRIEQVLTNLAIGRALTWGRKFVNKADMWMLTRVVYASGVPQREKILRYLLRVDGRATEAELAAGLGWSDKTLRRYAQDMQRLELVEYKKGGGRSKETQIVIQRQWRDVPSD
jgi:hypothetical protein